MGLHPYGYRFAPKDEELIKNYLQKRVHGLPLPCNPCLVYEVDVYAHEPKFLPWPQNPFLFPDERYYFVKRERMSKNSNGKRPRRNLEGQENGGWWKANAGDKDILDNRNNLIGHMKSLTFFSYRDRTRKREEATKTEYIMHEFSLSNTNDTFQEWVLCRIKCKGRLEMHEANNDTEPLVRGANGWYLEQHNAAANALGTSAIEDPTSGTALLHMQQQVAAASNHDNNNNHNAELQQQLFQVSLEGCNNIDGTLLVCDVRELEEGGTIDIEQLLVDVQELEEGGAIDIEQLLGDVQELEEVGTINIEQQQQQQQQQAQVSSESRNNNMDDKVVLEYVDDDVYDLVMQELEDSERSD